MADFAEMIGKERDRIGKLKENALTRRAAIDEEIAGYDLELKAIVAYETTKTGKTAAKNATGTRKGSRRDGILAVLKDKPDGMTRGEILEAMGLKNDKTGGQSVSNALSNMRKDNTIGKTGDRYLSA